MTSREARFGLFAFALLLAGLGINLLARQGPVPAGPQKARSERGLPAPTDKARRQASAMPDEGAGSASLPAGSTQNAAPQEGETADTIRAIQRELQLRGYETGTADGVPGLMTRAAIMAYEHDHHMALTAEASEDTLKRVLLGGSPGEATTRPVTGADRKTSADAVLRTVQQTLSGLGYNTGKVDGRLGEDTQRAIREFEADNKMPDTGRVSGTLIARMAKLAGNGRLPGSR